MEVDSALHASDTEESLGRQQTITGCVFSLSLDGKVTMVNSSSEFLGSCSVSHGVCLCMIVRMLVMYFHVLFKAVQ